MHRQPTTCHGLVDLFAEAIANRDRIISPDHLSEVAGCGQLVVQAAVDHQILAAPGLFAIDNPGDVDAAFADNVPAELDHHLASGRFGSIVESSSSARLCADGGQVERLILVEVWDAEAAAEIDVADRRSICRPAPE